MRYIAGCSASLTGRARIEASAILSLKKYATPFMASAMTAAKMRPPRPPTAPPMTRISADMRPRSAAVFGPLCARCTTPPIWVLGRNPRRTPNNAITPHDVPFKERKSRMHAGCKHSRVHLVASPKPPRKQAVTTAKEVKQLDRVIIRFAGDSGDGMQLTGDRFTSETAAFGNDLSTLPDFPAEIRAPAGTLAGVSGFQLHFADYDILTPGDRPDVLVAMNPAALKANIKDLPDNGDLIVNTDEFTKRNLAKVGYDANPLEDDSLVAYNVHPVPLTDMTVEAVKEFGLSRKDAS